jgi:hypothetical protein
MIVDATRCPLVVKVCPKVIMVRVTRFLLLLFFWRELHCALVERIQFFASFLEHVLFDVQFEETILNSLPGFASTLLLQDGIGFEERLLHQVRPRIAAMGHGMTSTVGQGLGGEGTRLVPAFVRSLAPRGVPAQ